MDPLNGLKQLLRKNTQELANSHELLLNQIS